MIDFIKKYAGVVALILAILALTGYRPFKAQVYGSASECTDGYTCYTNVEIQGNSITDGTSSFVGAISAAAATFSGLLRDDAGIRNSYTLATTSTATAETLVEADILNYDTISMLPNVGAVTLTFPATSTVTNFVPTAGDMQRQCWVNATTTTSINITFVAGSGFDFEVASSTAKAVQGNLSSNLVIKPDNSGCFTFIRKSNTDITAEFQSFTDAD